MAKIGIARPALVLSCALALPLIGQGATPNHGGGTGGTPSRPAVRGSCFLQVAACASSHFFSVRCVQCRGTLTASPSSSLVWWGGANLSSVLLERAICPGSAFLE